jgi:hypothetical protein
LEDETGPYCNICSKCYFQSGSGASSIPDDEVFLYACLDPPDSEPPDHTHIGGCGRTASLAHGNGNSGLALPNQGITWDTMPGLWIKFRYGSIDPGRMESRLARTCLRSFFPGRVCSDDGYWYFARACSPGVCPPDCYVGEGHGVHTYLIDKHYSLLGAPVYRTVVALWLRLTDDFSNYHYHGRWCWPLD